jgi:hypothetical protein
MKTLKTLMAALAILVPTALGHTQNARTLPTEIDLRAQYCLPFVQYSLDLVTPLANASVTPPIVDPALLENHQNALRRLQRYLRSRLPSLDSRAMAAARKQGETDLANSVAKSTCDPQCRHLFHEGPTLGTPTDPWMVCMTKCWDTDPGMQRLKMCDKLDWLPY